MTKKETDVMKEHESKRLFEKYGIRVGKTHTSKSKMLRDCLYLSSLNLPRPIDTYDFQDIENYLREKAWAVHHDSSCPDHNTLVWSYDPVNEVFVCEDYLTFDERWDERGFGINNHLSNVRRRVA